MKRLIIGLLGCLAPVLLLIGCEKNPVRAHLAEIETYAESNPDSARQVLANIDPILLNTRGLQAQHALMLSTAISRCKIKAPSDSLIKIAVDYYDRFGPRKERFLSYYYLGRIYEDLGEYDAAMKSYVEAESIHSKDISLRYLTSLQLRKAVLYREYYDYDKAVEAYRNAQEYASKCNWKKNYLSAQIGELTTHIIFERTEEQDSLINSLLPYHGEMTPRNQMTFDNDVILSLFQRQINKDSILTRVHAFERDYSSREDFLWSSLSLYYSKIGDYQNAQRALDQYTASHNNLDSDVRYLQASSALNDSLGFVLNSQKDQSLLHQLISDELYGKSVSNLRFMEEEKAHDTRNRQLKKVLLIGSVAIILIGIFFIWVLRKRKKQKEELSKLYLSLKEEYDDLSRMLQNNINIQDEARVMLGQRVKSLGQFLSGKQPASLERVSDQIDSLTKNRKELLETIGLLYAVYYPAFVNRLHEFNLSNGEIGYCCLLILGFRTGEIGDVINRSSSYHISSSIRHKIGLGPNDTNLSIFLKKMFKEEEP